MGELNYFWNKYQVFQRFQSTRNTQLIASFNRQNVKGAITTSTSSAFCRLNGQHSSEIPRKLIQIPFSQPLPFNFWHSFWQKIHKLLPQRGLKPTQETLHAISSFFSLFFLYYLNCFHGILPICLVFTNYKWECVVVHSFNLKCHFVFDIWCRNGLSRLWRTYSFLHGTIKRVVCRPLVDIKIWS